MAVNGENQYAVDNSHLLDDDLEYYNYADSLAERQRLWHEIADEMVVDARERAEAELIREARRRTL